MLDGEETSASSSFSTWMFLVDNSFIAAFMFGLLFIDVGGEDEILLWAWRGQSFSFTFACLLFEAGGAE